MLEVYTLENLRSHVDCGESFTPSGKPFIHMTLEAKNAPQIRSATAETLLKALEAILHETWKRAALPMFGKCTGP